MFCIRRGERWLIEQRPARGRWAGMWQFVTVASDESAGPDALAKLLPVRISPGRSLGTITHGLTHRRYHFDVFACEAAGDDEPAGPTPRAWTTLEGLSAYPLPRPHVKAAELLKGL
jgi:adenine-specific DNA glycosylase